MTITNERIELAKKNRGVWMIAVIIIGFFMPLVEPTNIISFSPFKRSLNGPEIASEYYQAVKMRQDIGSTTFNAFGSIDSSYNGRQQRKSNVPPSGLEYFGYLIYLFPLIGLSIINSALHGKAGVARLGACMLSSMIIGAYTLAVLGNKELASQGKALLFTFDFGMYIMLAGAIGLFFSILTFGVFKGTATGLHDSVTSKPNLNIGTLTRGRIDTILGGLLVVSVFLPTNSYNSFRSFTPFSLAREIKNYLNALGGMSGLLPSSSLGTTFLTILSVALLAVSADIIRRSLKTPQPSNLKHYFAVVGIVLFLWMRMHSVAQEYARIQGGGIITNSIGFYLAILAGIALVVLSVSKSKQLTNQTSTESSTQIIELNQAFPADTAALSEKLSSAITVAKSFDFDYASKQSVKTAKDIRSYLDKKGSISFIFGLAAGYILSIEPSLVFYVAAAFIGYVLWKSLSKNTTSNQAPASMSQADNEEYTESRVND